MGLAGLAQFPLCRLGATTVCSRLGSVEVDNALGQDDFVFLVNLGMLVCIQGNVHIIQPHFLQPVVVPVRLPIRLLTVLPWLAN